MTLIEQIKKMFQKKSDTIKTETSAFRTISLEEIKKKFEADDLNGAARDLKMILEYYGKRKSKKHKFKGREFINFILGSKHNNLKNSGFMHWQSITQIIESNQKTVYPFNRQKLKDAIDFFSKEVRDLYTIKFFI